MLNGVLFITEKVNKFCYIKNLRFILLLIIKYSFDKLKYLITKSFFLTVFYSFYRNFNKIR